MNDIIRNAIISWGVLISVILLVHIIVANMDVNNYIKKKMIKKISEIKDN